MRYNYHVGKASPSRIVEWDATIERNRASTTGSLGILRNSVNQQWTVGAISKAFYNVSKYFKMSVGIDWRKAEIDHFREVRDLLGGEYFISEANDFDTPAQYQKVLGDKIVYFNTNTVDWLGFYGQGEYTKKDWTVYATYGWSTIKYSYLNHFSKTANGSALFVEADNINGYQLKGGVSYRATNNVDMYANVGTVRKVPIFDQVIDDNGSGALNLNPSNEKFNSWELGLNLRSTDGKITAKFNYYNTQWDNRSYSKFVRNADGSDGILALSGVNQKNSGFELESAWQPSRYFRLDAAASIGSWNLTNDPSGVYTDYDPNTNDPIQKSYSLFLDGIKVGDAPQTQFALAASLFPVSGMTAQIVYKYYANYYADWDPLSRSDPNDRGQSWKIPSYGLVDLHFSYNLPLNLKNVGIQLFAHVFNVFDKLYVSDALDNSSFNAYRADGVNHKADDAEVFMGIPRIVNVGVRINL